jgi:hypothetical protein
VISRGDRMDCRIMLSVSGYSTNSLSGTFTAQLQGNGKWAVYFKDID